MKRSDDLLLLSASDLVGHLNCSNLTEFDLRVANGTLPKPDHFDPLLDILRERGFQHEQSYIKFLKESGFEVCLIDSEGINDLSIADTTRAMQAGHDIIVQAAFRSGCWQGRADVLRKVSKPSKLGDWSYEIIDTKLARETKAGTVIQLCMYSDLLCQVQGCAPEYFYVVSPWTNFEPEQFRFDDYAAYYRSVKVAVEKAIEEGADDTDYPDPRQHCDVCRWQENCDKQRRSDDHLCLVADISKNQINELRNNGISTVQELACMPVPIPFIPVKGAPASYAKIQRQAAIQVKAREEGSLKYDLRDIHEGTGLAALPSPSLGDVFFDIEGDPFVGEQGLEYLFGYCFLAEDGTYTYQADWAFDRAEEKAVFEKFVDFIFDRLKIYPDMHIYHYAPYEPGTLKRLMGRYATREHEIDNLLRGQRFVDLLNVVRHAMHASVESYSLKRLEGFFDFDRQVSLHDANVALTSISSSIELNAVPTIDDEAKSTVETYNKDDCLSAAALRDWLEAIRSDLIQQGKDIPRPIKVEIQQEELDEKALKVRELIARLTHDVPVDERDRSAEQHARWVLAYILEWHRRELKATWWEYFRLRDLTADDLINEKSALGRLEFIGTVDQTKTGIPTHRYRFEQQDTDLRGDEDLRQDGGDKIGTAVSVCTEERTIDIKKTKATADVHPNAVFKHKVIGNDEQEASLFRLGEYVAEHGIEGSGHFGCARALLMRLPPLGDGQDLLKGYQTVLEASLNVVQNLREGVLPIQGPPGTGKSFTGAHMICALVKAGKRVGVCSNSHKVIRNLLDKVIEVSDELSLDLQCIQKPNVKEDDQYKIKFTAKNDDLLQEITSGSSQVAGATSFFWAREEAQGTIDVLFVDEAAQMSLANVLAIAPAADSLVMLGDPQQLDQPTQGSHPEGTEVSALEHIIGDALTITKEQGLFLNETWRMAPAICEFDSELFYESKLVSVGACAKQVIQSDGKINDSGLYYVPVTHTGNTSSSVEEAEVVKRVVEQIIADDSQWINRNGEVASITLDDILIITPYNAQVFEIQQMLPMARVGTVDKFQGQEAPIAIYSMATSSHSDAPRGMEFLYSSNRFNVAVSRAKCSAILIASPMIFEAECRTARQMQLANAFCRYMERAQTLEIDTCA